MYLKSLTIKGFKSFAEPTTLDLERGVTVVVGPNGSGKSNVVDAIAWVLGAQAPSLVRSQKMDDVIFAGTSKRSALGRAEVSITIDNGSQMLPVELTEVTVTRTLFRSGESEYAINGAPCRLLDIQELLSDSGVGRQQHVIVSQGQLDQVLNARPEERRLLIEEAAGVLKFRKRKERSERRLEATEANLTRLTDLLREVRRQLRPLERQAEAARRYDAVVAELTALRIHTAGRELATLRSRYESAVGAKQDAAAQEKALVARLGEMDAEIFATEARLTAMGGHDLGDDLASFESIHERARGLAALLAEHRRGIERDRNASVDQGVVASLEAEANQLSEELTQVRDEADALGPEMASLEEAERELAEARRAFEETWAEGVPAPSGKAAEVRGELSARTGALERSDSELSRIRARMATLQEKESRLAAEAERLREELSSCEAAEKPLVESLERAEAERVQATKAVTAAEEDLRSAQEQRHSWSARAEALALALDEARAKAGAERLAGTEGVLGTLAELVEVDPGWEAAFEAAAGEALAAVVVADPGAGRRAIAALSEASLSGAVLGGAPSPEPAATPAGGSPLRPHVRARRGELEPVLDGLLGAVAVTEDASEAIDLALTRPSAVVVTRSGDRFAPTGWRLGAAGSGATGAALEEARQRAEAAEADVALAEQRLGDARGVAEAAQQAEAELSRSLDDNDGRMTAAADALARVESERRDAAVEVEALGEHVGELVERGERERERISELQEILPTYEAEESELAEQGRQMVAAREDLERRATEVGARRTDLEVRSAAVEERRNHLERRLGEIDQRLERSASERADAAAHRAELERRAQVLERLSEMVGEAQQSAAASLSELREQRRRESEAAREVAMELEGQRRRRGETEKELAGQRERLQRGELEEAEIRLRIEAATETLRRDLDCEPDAAMAAEAPPLAEGVTASARIRELERDLRTMGPINPLALEEYEALQERHEFLQAQMDDVKSSRRELSKIIRAIDDEIVSVFAAAFADVSENFEKLFSTLFPGGTGRLTLTEPNNLLETGIEVEAKPSGKNVKKLSLLSGGERSLTALAFLFSVFRSRPSPFYVMDEVEAALDDVNLHRFLGLVDEFRNEAQLIIVSHQKRTMEAADCLYGVSMQPGGSSKVVSERAGAASA